MSAAANLVPASRPRASLALSGGLQLGSLQEVFRLAEALAEARGFIPRTLVGDPNAIAAAILTGMELGMGPMESMRVIHMVEGRPTMSADTMLARAIRAGVRFRWKRITADIAECEIEGHTMSFSMRDAQAAGLASKDNWRKYPGAMLRARCISAAIRAVRPDVLGPQVYIREELEPDARVEVGPGDIVAPVPPRSNRLSECETQEQLVEWARANGPRLVRNRRGRENGRRALLGAARRIGCSPRLGLEAAGLELEEETESVDANVVDATNREPDGDAAFEEHAAIDTAVYRAAQIRQFWPADRLHVDGQLTVENPSLLRTAIQQIAREGYVSLRSGDHGCESYGITASGAALLEQTKSPEEGSST